MLRIGVIPMPPARNTAGLVTSLCRVNDPLGRLTVNFVPRAAAFNAFLNAVLRMRIAIMIGSLSRGELASEKVRELSLSLPKTKSACCPARNPKLTPFVSNQKAIVTLEILCRSISVISYSAMSRPRSAFCEGPYGRRRHFNYIDQIDRALFRSCFDTTFAEGHKSATRIQRSSAKKTKERTEGNSRLDSRADHPKTMRQ